MHKRFPMMMVAAAVVLATGGCSSRHNGPSGVSTGGGGSAPPTDFADFVQQQVQVHPAYGTTPAATTALTTDLGLGDATEFSTVSFGAGDALPAGTNQASVACTQAGKTACNPSVSADPNSGLN